jgi:tetratricopeptide (TPR) repeat protein
MRGSRSGWLLWVGLALLLGGFWAFHWVPSESFGVLQNRVGRSNPQILDPGMHWKLPIWETIEVYERRPKTLQGKLKVATRDHIEVDLPYELQVKLDEEKALRAHREGKGENAWGWIRHETERALRVTAGRADAYQLAGETLPPSLGQPLRKSLARWGLQEGTLRTGPGEMSPSVRASFSVEKLRAMRKPTRVKVALIGYDGADWDVALPMIERGELPNLAKLRREGAFGKIRTNHPPLSPLLWTTVATGKSPDIHGINDFLVLDPKTGRVRPISSDFRRVKALWNIASDAGLTSEFIAWWATWPAEPVRGIQVSDRVSYSLFSAIAGQRPSGGETYPEGYYQEIQRKLIHDREITLEELSPLVRISAAELAAARAPEARRGERGEDLESVATLLRILASTENYRRIALDLLDKKQPDLFAVYFQGIDEVGHRFAHLAPPRMPGVAVDRFRKYSGAVAGFYRLQDRILGEILGRLSPDTVVILLSDHGFASGAGRPKDVPPFISGRPGLWHTPFGLLVLRGGVIKPGPLPTASLFDILPTVLDLLGLPEARDLPGHSLRAAFIDHFQGGGELPTIVSYEAYGIPLRPTPHETAPTSGAADGEAMVETLRSLGYVGPAPAPGEHRGPAPAATTALYHSNLASILTSKGNLEGGEEEYRKALQIDPDTVAALIGLSQLEERKGRPDQALALLRRLIDRGLPYEPDVLIRMAGLFARSGRSEDGLIFFDALRSRRPAEPLLDTARGVLYSALDRPEEAEKAFRQSLARDPLSIPAMEELFVFLDRRGNLPELAPDLEAALRKEEGSFMHHNWLGLVYRRQGNLEGAERELKRASDLGPDQMGPLANLGILYLQEGRTKEALEVLERALTRDPLGLEVRTNLIVALAQTGSLERARSVFEEGRQLLSDQPSLMNAMAFAYQEGGKKNEAIDLLVRSLTLDPNQPQAKELLKKLNPAAAARFTP